MRRAACGEEAENGESRGDYQVLAVEQPTDLKTAVVFAL